MNNGKQWGDEIMTDKQINDLLKGLVSIPEYQKKQIAMLLIADTLTKKTAKDTFSLIR